MTWPTHALFGISTLWLLALLPSNIICYDFGALAACAAFGALLPDLDAPQSKIKHLRLLGTRIKPFLFPSQIATRSDQHRGLLHSLAGLGMVALMVASGAYWLEWMPAVALLFGYSSHLLADSATKSGIRLLYPNPTRFHLLPRGWRITTGSLTEEALFVLAAAFAMLLLLQALPLNP